MPEKAGFFKDQNAMLGFLGGQQSARLQKLGAHVTVAPDMRMGLIARLWWTQAFHTFPKGHERGGLKPFVEIVAVLGRGRIL